MTLILKPFVWVGWLKNGRTYTNNFLVRWFLAWTNHIWPWNWQFRCRMCIICVKDFSGLLQNLVGSIINQNNKFIHMRVDDVVQKLFDAGFRQKKFTVQDSTQWSLLFLAFGFSCFIGQGQLLQPFFRDTQRLFLYLLLVFLAQKVWPKKLGYFWYIKYKKKTRQITGYRLGWCPWKTLTGSRPRRFKVFFRWWNPLEGFIFCTKMNGKPLKIVSTEFTLSFKRNLKAIRPLLGP